MSESFTGFSNATNKYLKELKTNNNRDWFNANKDRYENHFLEPALLFIEAMQPALKKVSPHFVAVPKRSGGSLMRIYKDTRFAKDKTPYKTNIGIHFRHEFGKDVHAPGFYVHIEPNNIFFGCGIWRPDSSALKSIRDHIVDNESDWKQILRSRKLNLKYKFEGDKLKRPPRGFDSEHPLLEDLKRKDFLLVAKIQANCLKTAGFVDEIAKSMKESKPFIRFLCDSLKLPS